MAYTQNWDSKGNIYYTDENGKVVNFKVNPFTQLANKAKATAYNVGSWINETNPNSEAYKQKVGIVLGLATAPLGLGAALTGGIAKVLVPVVGRKIAQNMAQGIGSGVVGGAIGGGAEAGLNNKNIAVGGLQGATAGGLLGGLGGYGLGKVAQKLNTQTAWHGSPYKFDKFDNAYIGTGEHAQVHGHGHYTAKSKNIADERYRKRLTELQKYRHGIDDDGHLYKLTIPKNNLMIREDLPFSEQPIGVKQSLEKYFRDNYKGDNINDFSMEKIIDVLGLKNGEDIYNVIKSMETGKLRKNPKLYQDFIKTIYDNQSKKTLVIPNYGGLTAKELDKYGIKGISYKGDIDGEANVIFNPDDIDIIPYYDNPTSFKEKFINLLNR